MIDADRTGDLARLVATRVDERGLDAATFNQRFDIRIQSVYTLALGRGGHHDGLDAAVAVAQRLAVRRAPGVSRCTSSAFCFSRPLPPVRAAGWGSPMRPAAAIAVMRHRRIPSRRHPARVRGTSPFRSAQVGDRVRRLISGLQPSGRRRRDPVDDLRCSLIACTGFVDILPLRQYFPAAPQSRGGET